MQAYTRKQLFRHWRDLASAKKFKGSAIAVSYTHVTLPTICSV